MFDKYRIKNGIPLLYPYLENVIGDKKYSELKLGIEFINKHIDLVKQFIDKINTLNITIQQNFIYKLFFEIDDNNRLEFIKGINNTNQVKTSYLSTIYSWYSHNDEFNVLGYYEENGFDGVSSVDDLNKKKRLFDIQKYPCDYPIGEKTLGDYLTNMYIYDYSNFVAVAKKHDINCLCYFLNAAILIDYYSLSNIIDKLVHSEIPEILLDDKVISSLEKDTYEKVVRFVFFRKADSLVRVLELGNFAIINEIDNIHGSLSYINFNSINEESSILNTSVGLMDRELENFCYFKMGLNGWRSVSLEEISGLNNIQDKTKLQEFMNKYQSIFDQIEQVNEVVVHRNTQSKEILDAFYQKISNYPKDLYDQNRQLVKTLKQDVEELLTSDYTQGINSFQQIIPTLRKDKVQDSQGQIHDVDVYTLEGQRFSLLITAMKKGVRGNIGPNMYGRPAHDLNINNPEFYLSNPVNGSEYISTTLLNEGFIDTFVGDSPDLMYAYFDLDNRNLHAISDKDQGLPPRGAKIELFNGIARMAFKNYNLVVSRSRNYGEISLKRHKVLPNGIVCFDKIDDIAIKHAEYFNIPIILIDRKKYGIDVEKNHRIR